MYDLQEAACDHQILEEVNEHVLISKISMEENGSRNAPDPEYQRYRACVVADHKKRSKADFNSNRYNKA